MENKKLKIDNSEYLTLDGSQTEILVSRGRAYLFIVEKLQDGKTGARHEIQQFSQGEVCLNIPGNSEYDIILTGTTETEVEIRPTAEENLALALEEQKKIIQNLEDQKLDEDARSVLQQKLSDAIYQNTLANISSVINPKYAEQNLFNIEDSPLVKTFKLVARKINLKVRPVPGQTYPSSKAGIHRLAKDNTIRVREVALRDKWYKKDNGSLIAFYKPQGQIYLDSSLVEYMDDMIPVALVRRAHRDSYLLINPNDGSETVVNDEIASKIYPFAYMLYKSIDVEKIKIRTLLGFVLKDIKGDLIRYIIIGLLCTLIGLITPAITRHFIDEVIPSASKSQAVQICVLVFMTNMASMVGSLAKYFANLRMNTRADSDVEAAVIDRLLKLPVNFFKDYTSGDLAARALAITSIQRKIFDIGLSCFTNFIFSFIYLIQSFRYCGYFAKWGILFCLFPVLVSVITSLLTYRWEKLLVGAQGKIQGMLLQFLNGIEKINNSNSEKQVFTQWSKEFVRQTKFGYSLVKISNVSSILNGLFPILVSILFYFLYGYAIKSQKIEGLSTGTFMAFLTAYGSFQGAFLGVASALLSSRDIMPLYKRIKPILNAKPEIEENRPSIDSLRGEIEISHVNFRYSPDAPLILKDVCMKINPGQFVAIVGTSGAGKSTLLRVLLGFEKPEGGSVFYDNKDMNSVDIGSLRRQLGVVLQNDTVLQGTILQNIVGSSGLKEEDAWEAARKVAFDKDIKDMPMGMFTIIPAGGLSLSGGQLQRLIIARAIIRNPNILIFDEATSALDNLTQNIVRKSLDELKVTRIVIAHRLSTIINADLIYVMKDGQVIETGNYESLMKQEGYFAQLAHRQNL